MRGMNVEITLVNLKAIREVKIRLNNLKYLGDNIFQLWLSILIYIRKNHNAIISTDN